MKEKTLSYTVKGTFSYLQIFNGVLGLTDMELRVLAEFVDVKKQLDKAGLEVNPFSTEIRKKVGKSLGRDDYTTLNTYIKQLKEKGAIQKIDEGYKIREVLIPHDDEEKVTFVFNREDIGDAE